MLNKTKRFSIPQDLAAGIRNTINSATSNNGQLLYDMMPIENIETDPENPRTLLISKNEMLNGISKEDSDYLKKLKELEGLLELAESIKRVGVKHAIEVYKHDQKYRIITGERRYWASIIAKQKTVPVRISQKPAEFNLRYTQWIENINRKGLSLIEKHKNLILIKKAYEDENKKPLTDDVLKEILGVSDVQAYRYKCLLNINNEIKELVVSGKINNVKVIQELSVIKNVGDKNLVMSWIKGSKKEISSIKGYKDHLKNGFEKRNLKKPKKISLGSVPSSEVAKVLTQVVLADSRMKQYKARFETVDWSVEKNSKQAIKTLMDCLIKEFAIGGSNGR